MDGAVPNAVVMTVWGTARRFVGLAFDFPCSAVPVTVSGITNAVAVAAGDWHSCALLRGGSIQCWGNNGNGELGNGTTTNSDSFVPVTVSGITNAVAVAAGNGSSCALLSDSTMQCWGDNDEGQLGNGTTTNSSVPVTVSGIANAIAVTDGDWHSCALLSGGSVQCWGSNDIGSPCAYANGSSYACNLVPMVVSGITNAIAVTAGWDFTCALLSGGSVQCWGDNIYGQLGNNGTPTDSSVPVTVSGF